ncbi:hypothetical protein ACI762_06315 [Capnocytophaga canimorsus]|uniref:hypothetical protein n=1 Tax=Capnocytophaga canimorsus TaxID=28188 RepID=UPI00385A0677
MKKKKFDFSKVLEFLKKYQHYFMASAFILFVYLIIKSLFFSSSDKEEKRNRDIKDAPPVDTKGSKMTVVEADAKAERLFVAMNVLSGTDEDEIKAVLKDINRADYNMIYKSFGLRPYNALLGEGATFGWSIFGSDLDLTQWLTHELTASERNELRSLNPNLPI